jgi:hypothetical protein
MENLLRNGAFEMDWGVDQSHRCLVIPFDDHPYECPVDNIFTPPGWVTWLIHEPGKWDQPEVRDAWASADPHRVHAGLKATLLFTFWRRHWAGFYQQVQVTPGDEILLSAYAHAWSNTNLPGHPDCTDKARCSAGAGTQPFAIPTADAPPPTGDPWRDAIHNFTFKIGIDPTGGTHPLADTVIWGTPYHIYNTFHRLTVEAVAQAETITVFLSSVTQWPFKHNDAYWDSAELTGGNEEMRGQPRVQYERTYVLLPPSADRTWAGAVVEATWDSKRYTLGGSADDAGIGDLDVRRIIAVNPQDWPSDLTAFYAEHYPGIEYIPIQAETPEDLQSKLTQ